VTAVMRYKICYGYDSVIAVQLAINATMYRSVKELHFKITT